MTEPELVTEVTALCVRLRLMWHHCRDSRSCQGPRGLPDLIIAGPRGLIFAEIKSEDGETSPAQDLWIWTLDRIGSLDMTPAVWRPADLSSGEIKLKLQSIA
jgi:hypothetical protein